MIGANRPAPPNRPGANPAPIDPGPTNPPQSLQTPANRPQQTGQPQQTPGPGANRNNRNNRQPGPINRGQTPAKHSPNRWGPIAPQTGQTTNPGQSPANPKQPRKPAFEVSANQLSKAKKTPVLPGVVLGLRQLPKIANVKL
jgi:hypothetical protein